MKRIIIIRSLRVALVLAILCASMNLMIFRSYYFFILILGSLFFLDASDTMLVWRLKRIEDPRLRTSFIYVYLIATLAGVCSGIYALISTAGLGMKDLFTTSHTVSQEMVSSMMGQIMKDPFTLGWLMFSFLITIFAFRYFMIVVRVMARFLDTDEEC